ncbi:MAG: calcineurin-like phosphoesterase family protein [Bacteroidales bacterium]|nr:calcineurin-like phosphoesterase family protein [Bacteroidales bacterium]
MKIKVKILTLMALACTLFAGNALAGNRKGNADCSVCRSLDGNVCCEGKGVEGVAVSDGVNVVLTGRDGHYCLPYSENAGRFVFISTPSGYVSTTMGGEECFYKMIKDKDGDSGARTYDFTLRRNSFDDTRHKVIVVADPQISDPDDLEPLKGRLEDIGGVTDGIRDCWCFGINLGDMVGWNHSLYPRINKIFERSNILWRNVIGNHDMTNWGRSFETSRTDYENTFGPTYYSFNVGKVHYVVMNDNFFVGKDWYYIGYLDERQLSWLEKDLANVKKGSELVVCMHIPTTLYKVAVKDFSYPDIADLLCNNTALYKMLEPYHTTILTGHMHTNSNVTISPNIVEHNIGGLCGAWWCGDVCIDGCPPGCKVYERDGRKLSWYYKGENLPADCQMKVYADHPDYPGEIIAHVWDQDEKWKVEYWENGHKVCDMEHFVGTDPHAKEIFTDISVYKISWLAYFPSPNFFRCKYNPSAVDPEVRVTDRFGRLYIEKIHSGE